LSWENAELIRIFQGERMRSPEWLPLFPVIALIPEDLVLLSENHEERRRRLDALGTFLDPEYLPALLRYHSALRQLKALLLYPLRQPEEIVVYSELMEKEGRIVLKKRDSLLKALEEKLRELAGSSRGMKPSLRYIPSPPSSTDDLLRAYRRGEFREGKAVRLCGPHRDDWELSLKDESLHEMSQGQKKRLLLLMNLAEGSLLREARKGPPLLLWDELQEALDSRNLSFLLDLLKDLDLPVVTTSLDPFPSFARKGEWQVFTLRSPSSTPLPSA
jgi:DNA replication and repair protein RecF